MIIAMAPLQGSLIPTKLRPDALATQSNFTKNNMIDKEMVNNSTQSCTLENNQTNLHNDCNSAIANNFYFNIH